MKSVRNQVGDQVSDQIWYEVYEVWSLNTVGLQIPDRIRGHIRRQVRSPRISHEIR